MRALALSLALLLLPLFGFAAEEAPALFGQERAEKILQRAKDLDDFLSQPLLIEEYYSAMAEYYGEERFPRKSFDGILDQVRKAKEDIPGMKARLWETGKLGTSFTVEAAVQSSGRDINVPAWQDYLKDWEKRLASSAGSAPEAPPAKAMLKSLDARIADFERTLNAATNFGEEFRPFLTPALFENLSSRAPNLNKDFRTALTQGFYDRAREESATQALAATWLKDYLAQESTRDLLQSNEPDLILDHFVNLRNKSKELFEPQAAGHRSAALVLSALKKFIPSAKDLLEPATPEGAPIFPQRMVRTARGKLEPERTGKLVVEFKAPPRVFHTIFKGVPINECVGGACQSIDSLSVERWYSAGLDGTWFQQVERGGRNVGFVQMVPLANDDKLRAYSTDFGASLLRQRTLLPDPVGGKPVPGRFLDLWFRRARRDLPADNLGFLVSDNSAINNAGVKTTLLTEPKYRWGRSYRASEWKHLDPNVPRIVAYEKAQGKKAYFYGGNMVTDGTVDPNGKLSLLRDLPPDAYERVAKNPKKLRALIERGSANAREPLLSYLKNSLKDNASVTQTLREIVHDEKSPGASLALATLLDRGEKFPNLTALAAQVAASAPADERATRLFPLFASSLGEAARDAILEAMKEDLRRPASLAALGEVIQRDPRAHYQALDNFTRAVERDLPLLNHLFLNVPAEAPALQQEIAERAFQNMEKGRLPASEENLLALVRALKNEKLSHAGSIFNFLSAKKAAEKSAVASALIDLLEQLPNESHQIGSVWHLLRDAEDLPEKEIDRLAKIYAKHPRSDSSPVLEAMLRSRKSHDKLYRTVVSDAWKTFAATAGFQGWDFYKMQAAATILRNADFERARPTSADLKTFFSGKPSDSRARDHHKEIRERLNAIPHRGRPGAAPLAHQSEVKYLRDSLRAKGDHNSYDNFSRLGKILEPAKYAADLKALDEVLEKAPGYAIKTILADLLDRESVAQSLRQPEGAKPRDTLRAFLAKRPELLSAPFAKAEPEFSAKLLEDSFDKLLAEGKDALEGYGKLLRDRPQLQRRLVEHHEKNRLAPLAYSLPDFAPNYSLSAEQLDAYVKAEGANALFRLRDFFQNNEKNARLLLSYGINADQPRVVEEALEHLAKLKPGALPKEAYVYLAKQERLPYGAVSALRRLPAEEARPFATILLKNHIGEIDSFSALFPFTAEQIQELNPALQAMDASTLSQYQFNQLLQAGFDPPKPAAFFTADFFARQEKSFLAELFHRDESYLRRVQELIPTLGLSDDTLLKLASAFPPPEGLKLLDDQLLERLLLRDYLRYEDANAILGLVRRDPAMGDKIAALYAAHPEHSVPDAFTEYLPAFQKDKLRDALNETTSPSRIAHFMKRGRVDGISVEVSDLYAATFAQDQSLPKTARYLAAAAAFEADQSPAEMSKVLAEMMQDPAFAEEKRNFHQIATLHRGSAAPSPAKARAVIDLLEEATRQGAIDPFAYPGLFASQSFVSSRTYPERAVAYLAEAERRWGRAAPAPGTAASQVREQLLHAAGSVTALGEEINARAQALLAVKSPIRSRCAASFEALEKAAPKKKASPAKKPAKPISES